MINKQLAYNLPNKQIEARAVDFLYQFFDIFLYSQVQVPEELVKNTEKLPCYSIPQVSKQENYQQETKNIKDQSFTQQIIDLQKQNKIYNNLTIPNGTYQQNEICDMQKIVENINLTDKEIQMLKQQEQEIDQMDTDKLYNVQSILQNDKVRTIEIDLNKDQVCPIVQKFYKEEFDTFALYQDYYGFQQTQKQDDRKKDKQ